LNNTLSGTTGATPDIQNLVSTANAAQQKGDYNTAFQNLQQATTLASTLPKATPTKAGKP
jgi:hypothetical protein